MPRLTYATIAIRLARTSRKPHRFCLLMRDQCGLSFGDWQAVLRGEVALSDEMIKAIEHTVFRNETVAPIDAVSVKPLTVAEYRQGIIDRRNERAREKRANKKENDNG